MTFHVRYNDCHLEADMEREGERDRATGEWKEIEGGAEGGRKGEITGWKWFRSPLVLTRRPKPTIFCHFSRISLLDFDPFLPSLCCSLKLSPSSCSVSIFPAFGLHSFAINGSLAALRRITRWIAQSETPYILFRVGHGCQRPELSAITWASSWLSFTLPFLMRPDSCGWSYSTDWMLCW